MQNKIATIGFFDGVHAGHRFLFSQLRQLGKEKGLAPAIFTFQEHPKEVLSGVCPPLLTTSEERFQRLEQEGELHVLPFAAIYRMTAESFMRCLWEKGVRSLLMGYDHHFGSDHLCDFGDYARIGNHIGMEVYLAKELSSSIKPHVSSSAIRRSLLAGDLSDANRMLGYSYCISGKVIHGNAIGRTIGFPTVNLDYDSRKLLPFSGVYVGRCCVHGTDYPTLVNIGRNPTVGNGHTSVEGYLAGWHGDLYGEMLTIQLERFLRTEQQFDSLQALQEQIQKDLDGIKDEG